MGDIFERIKRQYDAWKLEQKYMRRRPASRLMGTHTHNPLSAPRCISQELHVLTHATQLAAAAFMHMYGTNILGRIFVSV